MITTSTTSIGGYTRPRAMPNLNLKSSKSKSRDHDRDVSKTTCAKIVTAVGLLVARGDGAVAMLYYRAY